MTREPGLASAVALFACGWGALATLGTVLTLSGEPLFALAIIAMVGSACSVKAFGGCEMLAAMIVFTVLGCVLFPTTTWAWIAPTLPGGFMVSAFVADLIWD